MATIPTITQTPKRYPGKDVKIPFYVDRDKLYRLKLRVRKINRAEFQQDPNSIDIDGLREDAIQYYITYYFPEFYAFLFDRNAFEEMLPENTSLNEVEDVVNEIQRSIQLETFFADINPNKSLVVLNTYYDFADTRQQWIDEEKMPSYEDNAAFFREENDFSNPTSQTVLTISTLLQDNSLLNSGLQTFDTQFRNFEGQLNVNVNFTSLQNSTLMILNMIVQQLMHQIKQTAPGVRITDADTITIQFGSGDRGQAVVTGIQYLISEESIESQPLKVGEFSYALYHRSFKDPMSLAVLKDYRNIINGVQRLAAGGNGGYGSTGGLNFMDFLNKPETIQSLGAELSLLAEASGSLILNIDPEPQKALEAEFLKVAAEAGLIDISDTKELEKGFTESFTTEEINKLKTQIAMNPALYTKVASRQKTRMLKNALEVTNVIDEVMNKGPLGLLDKSPAGKTISKVFRTFGLDALAKEIVICLTGGFNIETSRITQAVRNSLTEVLSKNYYKKPQPPKTIVIPKIDEAMFKPKLKDGNVGDIILGVLVDTLQEAALEAIKQMVELIRETCPLTNPRATDYGATNLEDYIDPDPLGATASPRGDQLDRIAEKNGLTPAQLMQYLRDVSTILSSVDLCNLLINQAGVTDELINKIIAFNEEYPVDRISQYLNTENAIMGFFLDVSGVADVTELCEEIANEVYQLNADDICLVLGTNLDDILDVIENGLQLQYPTLNFDCADKENFINDPTLTKAIPELFSTISESIELHFINSAEAIKSILLEPDLKNADDSEVLRRLDIVAEMGRQTDATGSLEGINQQVLNTIMTAIETLATAAGTLEEACDPPPSEILGFDTSLALSTGATIAETIQGAINDPAFLGSLSNINTKLSNINSMDAPGGISAPIIQTYDFNREFLNEFSNYIDASQYAYDDTPENYPFTVERNMSAMRVPPQPVDPSIPAVVSGETQTSMMLDTEFMDPPQEGDYYAEYIKFDLPTLSWPVRMSGDPDYLRIRYPREEFSNPRVIIDFRSTVIDTQFAESLASNDAEYLEDFADYTTSRAANPYVDQFVDAYRAAADENGEVLTNPEVLEVETFRFPEAYAALVDGMFDYVLENGVFTAAKLQSLNFFHLNENCPPNEVADLLDINGILAAMAAEYREQACNSFESLENPNLTMRAKVRNIVKYGLYLLLIQLHIAEFILKNIFVFSAFTIDSLLQNTDGFLFKYFKSQVTNSLTRFLDTPSLRGKMFGELDKGKIEENLVAYFNAKIGRASVQESGGIRYTQAPHDIAFPAGTLFTLDEYLLSLTGPNAGPTPPQSFDQIIAYLISERLYSARYPINNTIRRALRDNTALPMNLALLSTYPVLEITNEVAPTIASVTTAASAIFAQQPTVFVVRRISTVGIHYALWFYDAGEPPAIVDDTSPYDSQDITDIAELLTDTDNDGIPDVVDADADGDGVLDNVAGAQAVPLIPEFYTGVIPNPNAVGSGNAQTETEAGEQQAPPSSSSEFQESLGVDFDTIVEVQDLAQDTTMEEVINDDALVDPTAIRSILISPQVAGSYVYNTPGGDAMVEDTLVEIDALIGQFSNLGFDIPGMMNLLDLSAIGADPAGVMDFMNNLSPDGGQDGNDTSNNYDDGDDLSEEFDEGSGDDSGDDSGSDFTTGTNEETGLATVTLNGEVGTGIWAGPFGDGPGGANLSGRNPIDTEMFGPPSLVAESGFSGGLTPPESATPFSGLSANLTVEGFSVLQGIAAGLSNALDNIEPPE